MAKQVTALLEALRPRDWIKNTFILVGAIFGERLLATEVMVKVLVGFMLFCLGASAVYLLNDLTDVEKDKLHPQKAKRPLASGRLKSWVAFSAAILIIAIVIPFSLYLGTGFGLWVLAYLVTNVLYSVKLKDVVIVDVMAIAAGFVIRVLAGCSLASVTPSDWLIICTITISLFLGFCKRRQELLLVSSNGTNTRQVLKDYSIGFLDQMIAIVTATALISYILYTLSQETVTKFGTRKLILTSPFVFYGIFRYLYIIYQKGGDGNPTDTFFSDPPFLINSLIWGAAVVLIVYGG
jgi:4-hydroxybenzoate polyprenyltransferase